MGIKTRPFRSAAKESTDCLCLSHDNEKISGTEIATTLILMGAAIR